MIGPPAMWAEFSAQVRPAANDQSARGSSQLTSSGPSTVTKRSSPTLMSNRRNRDTNSGPECSPPNTTRSAAELT